MLLTPPSVTNCHTFSDLLPPRAWRTLWTAPVQLFSNLLDGNSSDDDIHRHRKVYDRQAETDFSGRLPAQSDGMWVTVKFFTAHRRGSLSRERHDAASMGQVRILQDATF